MKIYSARYDLWLLTLLTAALFLSLIASFEVIQSSLIAGALLFSIIVIVALIVLVYGIPCEYYLDENHLRIRSGLRFQSIPYTDIQAAELAVTILPQPAWSLQRVDIVLASGIYQISPEKKDDFLTEINARISSAKAAETTE